MDLYFEKIDSKIPHHEVKNQSYSKKVKNDAGKKPTSSIGIV